MLTISLIENDRFPVWSLPGTDVFLSFESPGPVNIDPVGLTEINKRAIITGAKLGQVKVTGLEQILPPPAPIPVLDEPTLPMAKSYAPQPLVEVSPTNFSTETVNKFVKIREEKKSIDLKGLLSKSLSSIKKELPPRNKQELLLLRELEQKGKNRKTVVKLINDLLEKITNEVSASIAASEGKGPKIMAPVDLPAKFLPNLGEVVESQGETITIKLGPDQEIYEAKDEE